MTTFVVHAKTRERLINILLLGLALVLSVEGQKLIKIKLVFLMRNKKMDKDKKIIVSVNADISEWLNEQEEGLLESADSVLFGIFVDLLQKHEKFIKENGLLMDIPDEEEERYCKLLDKHDKALNEPIKSAISEIINLLRENETN